MSEQLEGQCFCGAIRITFDTGVAVADLPLRACQCGFCRRRGTRTTSHPDARLRIEAEAGRANRFRFGRKATDALICRECGTYVASLIESSEGAFATLNVAGVDLEAFAGRTPEPTVYDYETDAEKLVRRKTRWTPTVFVETRA